MGTWLRGDCLPLVNKRLRHQDWQRLKHTAEVALVACEQTIETLGEGSDEDVSHRAFGDALEAAALDITMPGGMGCECFCSCPRLGPRDLQMVEKEFLTGGIAIKDRSQFGVGDG